MDKNIGIKFDQGEDKRIWSLIPWKQLENVVKVLEHGAKKYSVDNWKYVEPKRYINALLRHVIAYSKGEKIDLIENNGSGLSHMAHAICCALFLMWNDDKENLKNKDESNNNCQINNKYKAIIAIDFDGTITDQKFPKIGKLKKNAKKYINKLYNEGCYIIIWTCRTHFQVAKYLNKKGIKYNIINNNCIDLINSGFKVESQKIYYDVLIDDRILGGIPTSWKKIYKKVLKHIDKYKDYFSRKPKGEN